MHDSRVIDVRDRAPRPPPDVTGFDRRACGRVAFSPRWVNYLAPIERPVQPKIRSTLQISAFLQVLYLQEESDISV
jgi:hypothetical protein